MSSALTAQRRMMEDPDPGSILNRRQAREDRRRQKRIVIFCNGDVFFKGKKLSITPNRYVSYNDLLQDLTYRMPQYLYLPNGVRQLFSPTSGRRVSNVTELRDGGAYVCAGNETFKPVKYGEAELTPWGKGGAQQDYAAAGYGETATPAAAAAGTGSASQFAGYNAFPPSRFLKRQQLLKQPEPASNRFAALRAPGGAGGVADAAAGGSVVNRQPKVVTVVKEGPRPRQVVKILLNRRGVQSYQQLLVDISDSFNSQGRRMRLRSLWTISGREVRDVGDLFRDEELFVGSVDDVIRLEQVSDLLDELYPGNLDVKSLLKHWERRLRRQEKRRGPVAAAAAAAATASATVPHRVEERDSGYEESDLMTATTPTQRLQQQQQQQDSSALRGDRLKQALEARRHSKPLPLIHEPQQQQPPDGDAGETVRQRRLEEQRLAEEAATAKKDKQRRLGKQQRDTTATAAAAAAAATAAAGSRAQRDPAAPDQQQAKGHVVLPPIQQSAKEPQTAKDGRREKQAKKDKKHSGEHQQQAASELPGVSESAEQVRLPALPPVKAAPEAAGKAAPQTSQQHLQASQQRRSVSPDDQQQRILSTVREEDKETEVAEDAAAASVARASAAAAAGSSQHRTPQQTPRHHQPEDKTPATTQPEVEPQQQQQATKASSDAKKLEAAKQKSASKQLLPDQQLKASADEQPTATTPRPLIRPISSSRFINERFDLGKVMGDGNFAIVRAAVKKESRNDYAMKVIDKSKLRGKEQMIINEVRIMKICDHPNIVRLYEEYETRTEIFLVMELVKGGDLFDAISQVVKFNETQAAYMVEDMASALFYLHSRNIVHRDLKPENLLVYRKKEKESRINLKLGDFGLAMEVDKPIYTVCGTPTYVAPEILEERGYGLEVDLWALGVITYILLCGFPPFRSRDRRQTELFQFIKAGVFEFLSPYWDHISLSGRDLIQHLLVVDRRRRYTAVDVLCHPWVVTSGGSKKLPPGAATMKEHQAQLREQLAKKAEEGLAEFQRAKASNAYWNAAGAK